MKEGASFVKIFENLVHEVISSRVELFAVILHPLEEGLGSSELKAHNTGDFLAGAVEEDQGRETFDLIFFGKSFVGGLEIGGLFFALRKVELHQDKILLCKILKSGLLEDSFGELHAGGTPVGACELEENRFFTRGGLGEGSGVIRAPDIRGVEAERAKKKGEEKAFHAREHDFIRGDFNEKTRSR